ncbi:hypothetical protein ACG74X_05030 [Marivita sp. S0852]|uniref:hypothetical protein n=1 Tax=Marivita sp. S0852 TaxID=3373893 RepID=UPI003982BEE4
MSDAEKQTIARMISRATMDFVIEAQAFAQAENANALTRLGDLVQTDTEQAGLDLRNTEIAQDGLRVRHD